MRERNRFALKEWAAVVEGLKTGRQVLLLRKGGIEEEVGGFQLEHSEFFLYPTYEHQNRGFLRPEFLADFDRAVAGQPSGGELTISAYAEVSDCLIAGDVETLRRLTPFHLWNDNYLDMRFNYKPEVPLRVLVLRAYEVPAVRIPFRPEYRGCRSWVELEKELPTASARPALLDAEFEIRRKEIRSFVESRGPAAFPTTPAPSAVK